MIAYTSLKTKQRPPTKEAEAVVVAALAGACCAAQQRGFGKTKLYLVASSPSRLFYFSFFGV